MSYRVGQVIYILDRIKMIADIVKMTAIEIRMFPEDNPVSELQGYLNDIRYWITLVDISPFYSVVASVNEAKEKLYKEGFGYLVDESGWI